MKKITMIIILIMIIPQISMLAIAQNNEKFAAVYSYNEISKNDSAHLVELFTKEDCTNCEILEHEYLEQINDGSETSIFLNWHQLTNNPSIDVDLRMEQLNISEIPEISVNSKLTNSTNLSKNIIQSNLRNQLNYKNTKSVVDLPLEINMLDTNNDLAIDSVKVSSKIMPHLNLSNDTSINVIFVEWRAIILQDNQEILKRNLVKEWVPKKDFAVEVNTTTNWSFTFTPEYLDAVGVELDQEINERYGIILFVTGNLRNEESSDDEILALNFAKLPNAAQTANNDQSLSWIFLTLLSLLALSLIIISERKREYGIPKLSGKIVERNDNGITAIMKIKSGNLPLEIRSIEVGNNWSLKNKKVNKALTTNEELELKLNIRRRKKEIEASSIIENPTLEVSIEIEELGGWVLNLPLKE